MAKSEATQVLEFFRTKPLDTARLVLRLAQDELDIRANVPEVKRGRPRGSRNKAKLETITESTSGQTV